MAVIVARNKQAESSRCTCFLRVCLATTFLRTYIFAGAKIPVGRGGWGGLPDFSTHTCVTWGEPKLLRAAAHGAGRIFYYDTRRVESEVENSTLYDISCRDGKSRRPEPKFRPPTPKHVEESTYHTRQTQRINFYLRQSASVLR